MLFGQFSNADGPSLSLLISGEGTVTMDFSLQYLLNNNSLINLYQQFGLGYKGRFAQAVTSSLQAALLQPSNNLTVRSFYTSRPQVERVASAAAAQALSSNGATLIGFQLLKVALPATVETNIINTMVSLQQQLTAGMIQRQVSINADTSFYVGLIEQSISIYTSNQTALAGEFEGQGQGATGFFFFVVRGLTPYFSFFSCSRHHQHGQRPGQVDEPQRGLHSLQGVHYGQHGLPRGSRLPRYGRAQVPPAQEPPVRALHGDRGGGLQHPQRVRRLHQRRQPLERSTYLSQEQQRLLSTEPK